MADLYTQGLLDRIAELEGIITAAIPFIGCEAYAPELVQRAEDAVDYGAEEWSRLSGPPKTQELEDQLVTERHMRGTVQERLNKCGFTLAELEAALARWQFIGTHDYTERRPKHLGGGPGAVDRPTWEIDGLDMEFDRARAKGKKP